MNRRQFTKLSALAASAAFLPSSLLQAASANFVSQRPAAGKRKFISPSVDALIEEVKKNIADAELAWMFENCFPNTLDTTVFFEMKDGMPDTYVITGDIDAMWLRDSSAQVNPYLPLCPRTSIFRIWWKGLSAAKRAAFCSTLMPMHFIRTNIK